MRTFQRASRLIRPAIGLPVLMALGLAAVFVLALGCTQPDRTDIGRDKLAPLPDVPVPAGFKFNMGQSSERKLGTWRYITHLYEGSASVRETAEFYRTNMPRSGWTLVDESLQRGCQRYTFDKGNESCYISVYDEWGTKVLIYILPKGSRPADAKSAVAPTPTPKSRP
jgi:hypothetical protein